LAQVYAAVAWYYDHQQEMDAEIEHQGQRLAALRGEAAPTAGSRALSRLGGSLEVRPTRQPIIRRACRNSPR
jgi:hypothetical protein